MPRNRIVLWVESLQNLVIVRIDGEGNRVGTIGILVDDSHFDALLEENLIPIFFLKDGCSITRKKAVDAKSRLAEAARDKWGQDISTGHRHDITKIDELDFHTVSGHIEDAGAIVLPILSPFYDSDFADATFDISVKS